MINTFGATIALGLSQLVYAAGVTPPVVEGNVVTTAIELRQNLSADVTITFEDVVGLTPSSIGLAAKAIDRYDNSLASRLGSASNVLSIPGAFPVMLTIEPPADSGLSFSGVVKIDLHTHNLPYSANTPLRFFSAPLGGKFVDVTTTVSSGSYRAGATKGTFSEFLIVADVRSLNTVVNEKMNRISSLLNAHSGAMSSETLAELSSLLAAASASYEDGNYVAAIQKVEAFADVVEASDMPNVWQSTRQITNVAGELRAAAGTLRFSLVLASNNL